MDSTCELLQQEGAIISDYCKSNQFSELVHQSLSQSKSELYYELESKASKLLLTSLRPPLLMFTQYYYTC